MTRILPCWKLLSLMAFFVGGCAGMPEAAGPGVTEEAALRILEQSSVRATHAVGAIEQAREVVLNNLRNAHATGFKRSSAELREGGKVLVRIDFTQGAAEKTGQDTDLAINGTGFFMVRLGGEKGMGYTRMGTFFADERGVVRLNGDEGYVMEPSVSLPVNTTKLVIGSDGRVMVQVTGSVMPQAVGQIQMARFMNPAGLKEASGGIYVETAVSGRAIVGSPGTEGLGTLTQGALEDSNVDIGGETIRLEKLEQWRAALLRAMKMPG